ncbi:MAG: ribosome maturation factor RimM [bacterium]
MAPDDLIAIGQVLGAFGIHGEAKVRVYSDGPERFLTIKRVFLQPPNAPAREIKVERVKVHKGMALVHLAGYRTPESLQPLLRQDLYIQRSERQQLGDAEYYINDLIGFDVVATDGTALGKLTEVISTGANDVYEVNGPQGRVLFPAIADCIQSVDSATRVMTVQILPGLIDPPKPIPVKPAKTKAGPKSRPPRPPRVQADTAVPPTEELA